MAEQAFIFDLTEQSFGTSAELNSRKLPVLVLFQDASSGPCFVLAERLAVLAREFAGRFVFAKVDVVEQQGLRARYRIDNVPTVLVLQDGEVARTEIGEMSDDELRALLKDFGVFRESDELRLQAREKHLTGDSGAAVTLLTEAIQKYPANLRVALDMVQVLLDIGQPEQALGLFGRLPDHARNSDTGKAIARQLLFLELATKTDGLDVRERRIAANPSDLQARFDTAVCRLAIHQYDAAAEQLFHIVEQDAGFNGGAAREMIEVVVGMVMPTDPDKASGYRRRLGNLWAG